MAPDQERLLRLLAILTRAGARYREIARKADDGALSNDINEVDVYLTGTFDGLGLEFPFNASAEAQGFGPLTVEFLNTIREYV
jgi:hypothetical protein